MNVHFYVVGERAMREGVSMETICASCGAAAPDGARFCPACGASLTRSDPLPAERRPVTVLFSDAVGSTAFTERAGDEAAYRFVQAAVGRMSDAIERHGGTITQFRGDGVMALFGAPLAQEHSAVQAVTAALEIQSALAELRDGGSFRIGLSTGPVVVGRVGDDVLLDYTAIGDTANVAARMEQRAEPGTVLISESTWRAVRQFVECTLVGELEVKGKTHPVVAYEAVRRRPIRTRLEAAVERGLGTFVGRDRELDLLLGLVDQIAPHRGSVVDIVGEAGIGKSRLLLELRRRLPDTVGWTEGHCSSGGEDAAYLPLADLLRNAFGIEEDDDPATIAKRVDEAAVAWSPDARSVVPYLKFVLDVDPGDDGVANADPRIRRAGVIDALRVALADASRRQRRVLVIEDVHWADDATTDVLRALGDTIAETGVLLITTSRPGYESPFGARSHHTRVPLDSLSAEDAAALTADVLAVQRLPTDVEALITARTEGNPLFVEELTATLVESGLLVTVDGTCRLTQQASDIDVPGTLHDVILARIDRLAREARDALQLAAVIGREFTVRLLDRLTALPEGLDDTLEELKAVELIRQKAWFPELAYLFKHALTHEVTYATLLDERRRALHRLVAQAIEDVYADRLAEHVEVLAHHWLVAEEWEKALEYLDQAGERAMEAWNAKAASSFMRRAAEIAERLGDVPRAAALRMRDGDALMAIGDLDGAQRVFGEVATLARRAGDADRLAWALTLQGEARCYLHDRANGEASLIAALDVEGASVGARQYAAIFLWAVRFIFGRFDESDGLKAVVDEMMARGMTDPRTITAHATAACLIPRWRGDIATAIDVVEVELPAQTDLLMDQGIKWEAGVAFGEIGRYDDALDRLRLAIARGEHAGELMFRARSLNTVGWIHGELGDVAGCLEWNDRCLQFLAEVEIPDEEIESNARLNIAESLLADGQLDAAARQLARVDEIVRDKPLRDTWMLWRFSQRLHLLTATSCLLRGERSTIGSRIDDALALATESGSVKYIGKAARVRGHLLLASRELEEAAAETARDLEIASGMNHPPEQWRAHVQLARIADARSDSDGARHHREQADAVLAAVSVSDPALRAGVARLREAAWR